MLRIGLAGISVTVIASALVVPARAQQPAPPPFATTKVTDNVYIFRYVNHQAMFIVTPSGVIATDPISERRTVKPYIDAIQAVTKAPIKYVVYSHSHYDHVAGGQPFKDLGAVFVAHRNARERIAALKPPDVVVPDQAVDGKRNIALGGTTLELNYVGKIAMDWETLIPGHPGPGGKQTGNKDNAREELAYLGDLSAAVKQAVSEGKSYADAQKDIRLPKYEAWPNYNAFLPMNIERYYDFWNRGI